MLYHLMPKPNKSKATGDKNSGYTNTVKINNTTYRSNKDIIYSHLSKIINIIILYLVCSIVQNVIYMVHVKKKY